MAFAQVLAEAYFGKDFEVLEDFDMPEVEADFEVFEQAGQDFVQEMVD